MFKTLPNNLPQVYPKDGREMKEDSLHALTNKGHKGVAGVIFYYVSIYNIKN